MGAANKLKELFDKNQPKESENVAPKQLAEQKAKRDKVEVEYLRKTLQDKFKKDPKLNKKAAMIIEQMINQKPPKK